jgi:hypothetical protein
MDDDLERKADEEIRTADNLVRSQEAEVARMRASGINTRWADTPREKD